MKTAIIVSTYKWPEALALCLKSILRQTVLPDEIIIADDGSGEETKKLVQYYAETSEIQVKHVWHEDKGFRLAKIRNLAIKNSESEYLIFIDGDIILHSQFVSDHIKARTPNTFLTGSRVLLSKSETEKLFQNKKLKHGSLLHGSKNKLNAIHCSILKRMFSRTDNKIFNVRGCNMSFWKTDLEKVNGFDEQYEGWGREDSDIVLRLLNNGKTKKKLKFTAVQYHLYHNEKNKRNNISMNDALIKDALEKHRISAFKGLSE